MKKIIAVSLILCLSMCFLTACTSLSTYQDRLAAVNQEEGTYIIQDFAEELEVYAEQYGLNSDDYSIIESIRADNKKVRTDPISVVIIATWSESKAEKLAGDLDKVVADLNAASSKAEYEVVQDGRFVIIGDVRATAIALGK